jgi:ATP-binding cassette subfamily B protein
MRRQPSSGDSDTGLRDLLGPLARPQRRRLAAMSVASILAGFAEAGLLIVMARIAFALAEADDKIHVHAGPFGEHVLNLWQLLAFAALLAISRMILQGIAAVMASRVNASVMLTVRNGLARQFLGADWKLQSRQREGRLQEYLSGYAASAGGSIQALTQLLIAAFNLGVLLVTAFVVEPLAAVGAAIAAGAIGLLLRPLRRQVRRRGRELADANLEFATGVTEIGWTLQEVRIFGVEQAIGNNIERLARETTAAQLQSNYINAAVPVLYQGTAMLLMVGILAVTHAVDVGGIASLGAVLLIMLRSLGYAQAVQGSIQGLHATAPLLESLRDEQQRYRAAEVPRSGKSVERIGSLAFENVAFEYDPGQPVLTGVSFSVHPGEIVGIVGPSGAGKSTLVQLLLRLREPTTGRITADGRNVTEISLESWYDHFTFVSQDTRLFAGTIADNIRFFRESVGPDDIERAAKLAHLHDDIVSWPLGYETPVGERGGQLSGGQKQRLCIARALAEDPEVVVFDEPTSALDVKSEALMRNTMAQLGGRRTVFVIAHRLSTLTICDRIMVILDGRMQGFDEPAALEASNPFYREALRLSGMR